VGVCDIGAYEYNPGGGTAAANTASGAAKKLPTTGFAPNRITTLPSQPEGAAYRPMGALWLEIPSQNVKANIVGVPEVDNNWDVTWLGADAGWLNETAFPTWAGNSVITAHVTDANGLPGPFANLKVLAYGNKIVVHQFGEKYTFEVRQSRMVFPDTTAYAFEHLSGNSYLTLITCQGYNFLNDSYMFRRVVRAVLVSVEAE
jgi:LPXTG-site transpeptidase (sortase) family protein